MRVTFDTNVWQLLVTPEEAQSDPEAASFVKLHAAILAGKITPFISETIFTLEGIDKKDRQGFWEEYEPKFTSTDKSTDTVVRSTFMISSDEDAHPGNNRYLKKYLTNAVDLGFKIIRFPRIGGIKNKDIEGHILDFQGDYYEYMEYASSIAKRVEELGSGRKPLRAILSKYPPNKSLRKLIAKVPDYEAIPIARAIAEAADADSITAHIAMGHDYFCTRDKAKGAGQSSILGATNVTILEREYSFKHVTPVELAALL